MNRHSSDAGRAGGRRKAPRTGDGEPERPARADGSKRARILEAAVKVFAEKGFYNAKVSEIAARAGIADGTIYLYFKSKDELLISLFEDRMAAVNENVRAALDGNGDPLDKLAAAIQLHLTLVEQNPDLAEVLTVELRQSARFMHGASNPRFGEFLKMLAGPVEEGQKSGVVRPDLDPPVVARALFGALDELALAWLLRRRAAGPKNAAAEGGLAEAATQLAAVFVDGLRVRQAKSGNAPKSLKRRES